MQIIEYNHKIGKKFVTVTFEGDVDKVLVNLQKLSGVFQPDLSTILHTVWTFPVFVSFDLLNEVIKNTCFKCGGVMINGYALDNTWVSFDDFGNDAESRGTTMTKQGDPVLKKVRKCASCGHSHS